MPPFDLSLIRRVISKGSFQTCNAGRAGVQPYRAARADTPTRRHADTFFHLVRNCAKRRRADLFRVLRQDPFSVPRLWLFPFSKALRQLCLRNFEPNRPFLAVDFDRITILDDRYRPACKRLGSHVPNNKSVTAPGKSPIGD